LENIFGPLQIRLGQVLLYQEQENKGTDESVCKKLEEGSKKSDGYGENEQGMR
jgi:hypothetical protein